MYPTNVAEFARSLGMNATLLRNYINGFKKPSAEREKAIIDHIHKLGREISCMFLLNICSDFHLDRHFLGLVGGFSLGLSVTLWLGMTKLL